MSNRNTRKTIDIGDYAVIYLGDLLSQNICYSISWFQRDYSWRRDEWGKLYDDIISSIENNSEHFFGFMTFYKKDENKQEIIEGQQRLATVTIITAVVRDLLRKKGKENIANQIDNKFIKQTDPYSENQTEALKIELSKINTPIFRKYIQENESPIDVDVKRRDLSDLRKRTKYTNKLIIDCYNYFYEKLKDQSEEHILNFHKTLTRNFKIVKTEVGDLNSAYVIFQTLNDRGLELAVSDLLKVHLLQTVGDERLEEIKERWENILNLPNIEHMSVFLRHFWLSTRGVVKEDELLNKLKEEVKDSGEVFRFIQELEEEAENYSILLKPDERSFDGNKEITQLLNDELYILSKNQVLPILLALYKHFYKENKVRDFKIAIRGLITLVFRYLTIGENENKELEKYLSDLSKEIRNGNIENGTEFVKKLMKKDISDESFIAQFKEKQIKKNKVVVYILKKIEMYLNGDRSDEWELSSRLTLEHIIPLNPDEECKRYLEEIELLEDKDEWVHRIGNMTLLTTKANKRAQNKSPLIKSREIYNNETKLKINEDLKDLEKWGKEEIEQRQERFAKLAVEIWNLNNLLNS